MASITFGGSGMETAMFLSAVPGTMVKPSGESYFFASSIGTNVVSVS